MHSLNSVLSSPLQALKRLRSTMHWRKAEQADSMMCSTCLKQDGSHYMHVVGHDWLRRPVLYSCLAMPKCRSIEENRRHMIATFEQVRCMACGMGYLHHQGYHQSCACTTCCKLGNLR